MFKTFRVHAFTGFCLELFWNLEFGASLVLGDWNLVLALFSALSCSNPFAAEELPSIVRVVVLVLVLVLGSDH